MRILPISAILLIVSQIIIAAPDSLSGSETDILISTIIKNQLAIKTITCKLYQEYEIKGEGKVTFEGGAKYRYPSDIYVQYHTPTQEYFIALDSSYTFLNSKTNKEIQIPKDSIDQFAKKMITQFGQLKNNDLEELYKNYNIKFHSVVSDSETLLSATPKGGWKQLSKVLLLVNTSKKALSAIELYDKEGYIVSNTEYLDFIKVPNRESYYPSKIISNSVIDNTHNITRHYFSRLKFNEPLKDSDFQLIKE